MDSLLASYASSDEEGEEQKHHQEEMSFKTISRSEEAFSTVREGPQTSRIFSLPRPKSSSSDSFSLPQPKKLSTALSPPSQPKSSTTSSLSQPESSSLFSSLPPPDSSSKFSSLPPPTSNNPQTLTSSVSKPKKVVQFRPPIMLKPPADEDDDEEEEKERQRKPIKEPISSSSNSSLTSFFSSLPAPKNTLGSGSAPVLGAGRRSVIETNMSVANYDGDELESKEAHVDDIRESHVGKYDNQSSSVSTAEPLRTGSDPSNCNPSDEHYGSYGYYADSRNYEGYDVNYGNYDGGSTIPSTTYIPETSGLYENIPKMPGKRGRKEIPTDIVEVKQDELMKNRPREDQVKSTGIAFGPSYQPSSTKGKPSKLHKRKHQIGALYFDMRQKEHELAERRSKGFLTKAETQAKYGW